MNIIAIDCGASFIKGALINGTTFEIIKECYENTPVNLDKSLNHLEKTILKVEYIFRELSQNIDQVNLCFSNEMHGFVATNEMGIPYCDYISWQDECAYEKYDKDINYLDYLKIQLDKKDIEKTGMPIKAGLPNVNLFYYIKNEIISKDKKVYFYTLGDFLVKHITKKEPYIHITNAAATGIYDLVNHCWSKEIISGLGFDHIIFPKIGSAEDVIVTEYFDKKVNVYPAIGDQQAALLGAELFEKDVISLNFGTGAQISCLSEETDFGNGYQIRPFFYNRYIKTIPHIPSGRAINVFIRFIENILYNFGLENIQNEDIWTVISNITNNVKENDLKVDLSFFTNAVSDRTRGEISNISESNLKLDNLFDAIFERIADNVYDVTQRIINIDDIKKIVYTGGIVTKNEILQKKIENRFNGSINVNIVYQETFKGIARYMCGRYKYILFDFDGTLVNSQKGIFESIEYTLKKMNYKLGESIDYSLFIGPPLKHSFLNICNMDEDTADLAVKIFREEYENKGVLNNELYDGVIDMLIELKRQNKIIAIATSKPQIFVEKILKQFELIDLFDLIIGTNLSDDHSDKERIISEVINRLEVTDLQSVIMIGDRKYDILGGKENSIATMGVLYGFGDYDELVKESPDFIVSSAKEITRYLTV